MRFIGGLAFFIAWFCWLLAGLAAIWVSPDASYLMWKIAVSTSLVAGFILIVLKLIQIGEERERSEGN